jgi:predicted metal-binding membrane protein
MPEDVLERALKRDRIVVAAGLVLVTVLAWLYITRMAAMTSSAGMVGMSMPMSGMSGIPALGWLVPMWIIMMVAMMLPSAAPTILLFAGLARRRRIQGVPVASATVFALGYLLVWALYATLAAMAQAGLHQVALLSPSMVSASPWLGGGLLIAAGVYQWLPFKNACLSHCRSPLGFLTSEWREGTWGALVMGARHGTLCVGCCAVLMTLLFVAGVMNLLWVAAIAIFVLLEKVGPGGPALGRATGLVMIVCGVGVIASAVV